MANNQLGWKNQWRCILIPFYHGNQSLYRTAPHRETILSHGRERWSSVLAEIDIVKSYQGDIFWNAQSVFGQRTKNADSHEITSGSDGRKVASLG